MTTQKYINIIQFLCLGILLVSCSTSHDPVSPRSNPSGYTIYVEAHPSVLAADGKSASTIVATLYDIYGGLVDGEEIVFTTTLGTWAPGGKPEPGVSAVTATTEDGYARTWLISPQYPGTGMVTATIEDVKATVYVNFL